MQQIIIANNRAYLNGLFDKVEDNKVFHKKQDMKNPVMKSASFKIYTGLAAKFLSFIGIASKFQYGGGATGKELKTIYLNKKSFIKYQARIEKTSENMTAEELASTLEKNYPLTYPNASKVINHVNKHFNKIKKSCDSTNVVIFGFSITDEIKNKIDSLNKATS